MKKYKDIVKDASAYNIIWWSFVVFLMFVYPMYSVYNVAPGEYNGILVDNKFWMYIAATVTWNIFLCICLLVIFLCSLILGKLAIWIKED